ncbi:MAG: hypothetical protein Q9208_002714 [Pyrenodesmia sp. 3 TL-2023]
MSIIAASRHSFQAFAIIFFSAFLLLISSDRGLSQSKYGSLKDVIVRSQSSDDTIRAANVLTGFRTNVTQQLGGHGTNSSSLAKRAPASEADFQRAKEHGDIAYDQIQAAFSGCETNAQEFPLEALNNGWTRRRDQNDPLEEVWFDVFTDLIKPKEDKIPTNERVFNVRVHQDKPFTNSQGEQVNEASPQARYYHYIVPVISAIVISEMNSPSNQVRRRYTMAQPPKTPPASQYIADHLVPPLNRWSDVTWTLWKEKAGGSANNLRYIAHDAVENDDTDSIASYVFTKARNSEDVPYPGLEFGMDSREGRALLGTPNGIGTARLLIDRAKQLGKRELRVRIFTSNTSGLCMLWDMVPQDQPGSSGGRHRMKRHHGHYL